MRVKIARTSRLRDSAVSQSKGPPGHCSRSVRHELPHSLASGSVGPSCCLVGDGGVGGELLARVVWRISNPAAAGQTAHPLTRFAKRHCCSMLSVVYRNKWCLPRRRCFVNARSCSAQANRKLRWRLHENACAFRMCISSSLHCNTFIDDTLQKSGTHSPYIGKRTFPRNLGHHLST
jgi:hypothetical protein